MKMLHYTLIFLIVLTAYAPLYPLLTATRQIPQTTRSNFARGTTKKNMRTNMYREGKKIDTQNFHQATQLSKKSTILPSSFSHKLAWARHRFWQLLLGKTTTDIVEEIRNTQPTALNSFLDFIKKNDQNSVDTLLDELVFFDPQQQAQGLEFLEQFMGALALNPSPDRFIIKKIATWTSFNVMKLCGLTLSTESQESLLLYLTYIIGAEYIVQDIKNEETKAVVVPTIVNNLTNICATKIGIALLNELPRAGAYSLQSKLNKYSPRLGGAILWESNKIFTALKENYSTVEPLLRQTQEGNALLKKIKPHPDHTINE